MHALFKNRKSAHQELQHRGYKIGQSKFYLDCQRGLCRIEPDGSILESALDAYIANPLARLKRLGQLYDDRIKGTRRDRQVFLVIPIDFSLCRKLLEAKRSLSEDPSGSEPNGKQDG